MLNLPAARARQAMGPRRRPERTSEQADPTELPRGDFEEPAEEPPRAPDRGFDEPSADEDEELPEPLP